MNKYWMKLLMADGTDGNGSAAPTPEPSAPITPEPSSTSESISTPTPSERLSDSSPTIPERTTGISADVAEKLGIPAGVKPIDVKPMAALGLPEKPSSAIQTLIQKEGLKLTRTPIYDPKAKAAAAAPPALASAAPGAATTSTTPAKPAEAPVTPSVPTAQSAIAATSPTPTYNVQGRQMTQEQYIAFLEGRSSMAGAPQQTASSQPQMTPEQQQQFIRQRESNFVNETAPHIDLNMAGLAMTPEQADIIAAGGPEAVKLITERDQRAIATATLLARKTMAAEINPILQKAEQIMQQQQNTIAPILAREQQIAVWETEQEFTKDYPDLAPHIDTARIVGHELVRQFPDWARQTSRKDFLAQVAQQTPQVLSRFGITIGQAKPGSTPPAGAPAATPSITTPKNPPGNPAKIPTSGAPKGPQPIRGQAPGKPAAVSKPVQTLNDFQKVSVGSISNLR